MRSIRGCRMEGEEDVLTRKVYSSVLCEFLEIAIHLILYVRDVYPSELFQRRRKYNIPVYVCGHPEVNRYVCDVVDRVKPLLDMDKVEGVAVLIKNEENKPMEKFVFKTKKGSARISREDGYLLKLESELRSLLLKLSVSDALLAPNPPDCTFTIHIHTTLRAASAVDHEQQRYDFPWTTVGLEDEGGSSSLGHVVPLKSLSSDLMRMQLYVEESSLKKQ